MYMWKKKVLDFRNLNFIVWSPLQDLWVFYKYEHFYMKSEDTSGIYIAQLF